ncbi:MAG: helix-turn-helix transcriptional regulator [Aquirufa sp.]|jgi:transcriptional regulator with XRE-family HTH domain
MKTKHLFSVLLIKSRQSKRMTQQQVASAVGVSQSAYNYWESGKHYPNAQKLYSLTRVLSIPIDEMIGT